MSEKDQVQEDQCTECTDGVIEEFCTHCNGSGQGSTYNSVCQFCGGYGHIGHYCSCKNGKERRRKDYE